MYNHDITVTMDVPTIYHIYHEIPYGIISTTTIFHNLFNTIINTSMFQLYHILTSGYTKSSEMQQEKLKDTKLG